MGLGRSVYCCLLFATYSLTFHFVGAVVNLNLKSSLLTKLLRGDQTSAPNHESSSATQAATTTTSKDHVGTGATQKTKSDILQLDLSGRVHAHLIGCENHPIHVDGEDDQDTIRPLIPIQGPFSLILGTEYDFSQRWFGARRFLTTLRWTRQQQKQRFAIVPTRINVVGERSIEVPADAAAQLVFEWGGSSITRRGSSSNAARSTSTLRARVTRSGDSSLSLALPMFRNHNRVHLELNLVNNSRQLPCPDQINSNADWWIPDVTLNAMGHLKSQNEAWFRSPFKSRMLDGSLLGVRLVIRRRLGMSVLGLATDQEPETWVGIDVQGLDSNHDQRGRFSTSARVEAQLERLRDSARILLRQDIVVGDYLAGLLLPKTTNNCE